MVVRVTGWPDAFIKGFEAHLRETKRQKPAVVAALVSRKAASRQAVAKWFTTGRISDANLQMLADVLGVDYESLRLHATFVKPGTYSTERNKGSKRRLGDRLQEAAAGYHVVGLPTGREIAPRWDKLPSSVQAFLLYQLDSFERLAEANGPLADLLFKTPRPEYSAFEQELDTEVRRR